MSWASICFGGIYTVQALFHALENTYPHKNWEIYGENLATNLPKYERDKLIHLEEIKNKVCALANIPSERVIIRLQERGVVENHGNTNQSILGIGLNFLESYHPQNSQIKSQVSSNLRIRHKLSKSNLALNPKPGLFKEFLNQLPDNPEEIKKKIKKLTSEEQEYYQNLAKDYFLDLSDEEMQFVISHEIVGHMSSNDALKIGGLSTLLGLKAWYLANNMDYYLPFSGSSFIWQAIFYSISYVALQSVVVNRQERHADTQALFISENISGGIRFFKRILATNLLKKYQNYPSGSLHHFQQFFKNSEGEHLFNFSYENTSARLLRCLQFQEKALKKIKKSQ